MVTCKEAHALITPLHKKSSKSQDRLLKVIHLHDWGNTAVERAQEWQQAGVNTAARGAVRRGLLEDGVVSSRAEKK